MFVPPFFPPPIEVKDNVADLLPRPRLGFVRRVLFGLNVTLILIGGLTALWGPWIPLMESTVGLLALIAFLSLFRLATKRKSIEPVVSGIVWLPFAVFLASAVSHTPVRDMLWPMLLAPAISYLYAVLSGRDTSFIAMFLFAFLVSMAIILTGHFMGLWHFAHIGWEMALLTVWPFYVVYDLSMILRRRKLGQELGAVVDLYRDPLNLITYGQRVIEHWNRHRLWAK